MVITPASAHATSNHPGEPINRELSADVMKIPDPIIEPITIMVPSTRVRPRTSLGALVSVMAARFINSARTSKGLLVRCARLFDGQKACALGGVIKVVAVGEAWKGYRTTELHAALHASIVLGRGNRSIIRDMKFALAL